MAFVEIKFDQRQIDEILSQVREYVAGSTLHYDRSTELAAPIDARIYEGKVARVHTPGDGLRYSWGEELRDVEELANIVSQLPGKPITLDHPDGLVSDGAQAKVVGEIISARVDGDYAVARLLITDVEALSAIFDGKRDLSLGYQCHLDGNRYQRGIKVDHLALVQRGRCTGSGGSCELRGDSTSGCHCGGACKRRASGHNDLEMAENNSDSTAARESDTRVDELQKQLAEALADATAQKARADQSEKDRDAALAEKTALEVEATNARKDAESEKVRADQAAVDAQASMEKALLDAASTVSTQVAAKVALISAAAPILANVDLTKMSDREIKVAVIKHVDGDDISAEKPDAYVDGVYEGALKRFARADTSRADAQVAIQQMRNDGIQQEALTGLAAEQKAMDDLRRRKAAAWLK